MRFASVAFGFLLFAAAAPAPAQQPYLISTYAGGAPPPTPIPAVAGSTGVPLSVTADSAGNIFFANSLNSVFRLEQSGVLTRVAGNFRPGYSGDGGPATSARLHLGGDCCLVVTAGLALD